MCNAVSVFLGIGVGLFCEWFFSGTCLFAGISASTKSTFYIINYSIWLHIYNNYYYYYILHTFSQSFYSFRSLQTNCYFLREHFFQRRWISTWWFSNEDFRRFELLCKMWFYIYLFVSAIAEKEAANRQDRNCQNFIIF